MNLQDTVLLLSGSEHKNILLLRSIMIERFPITTKALRLLDNEYAITKQYKGYNLVQRNNKKMGFKYYVRYWHEGRMIPSKWCTQTNSYEKACTFAEQNRDVLISRYMERNGGDDIRFFKKFYDPHGTIFQKESRRNGELSEAKRKRNQVIMENKFIPFLKERKIETFNGITVPVLDDFQDYLLAKGMKAQSVNNDMSAVSRAFKYMLRKGMVKENPCQNLIPVPEKAEEKKTHGCHELALMKSIFKKRWKEKFSYLLNLIIYTTDMRNSEIKTFCKNDIITISKVHFIDLKRSKTGNGIRLVPLHNTVYRKIMEYANGMNKEIPIFANTSWYQFTKAYKILGKMLKKDETDLKSKNITYYSGRHFWKTLMNAAGLGEGAEEHFMGHRVTKDVAKLYNHRDMQGKKLIVKKAREIFKILDKHLFT